MREEILNKALELTEAIELTANGLLELSLGFEDTKANVAFIEATIAQEIAGETDEKGKAVFSNESARAAELAVRCRAHGLFQQGNGLLKEATENKTKLQNLLDKYRNQLSVYKAFLNGGVA